MQQHHNDRRNSCNPPGGTRPIANITKKLLKQRKGTTKQQNVVETETTMPNLMGVKTGGLGLGLGVDF